MLAERGTELGGPWSDHLTVFRKTRQHDQRQIDRAVRTQKACERDHRGPAVETYERRV
jgi:hypothetical protein